VVPLAGRPVHPSASQINTLIEPAGDDADAVISVRIMPSSAPGHSAFKITSSEVGLKGLPLRTILYAEFNWDPRLSEISLQPDDRIFDVEITVPGAKGQEASKAAAVRLIDGLDLEM